MTPLIGVVMSVYNGQRHLRAAIDSVLGQSLRDFELIVIDDASTDATPAILAGYRDARLRVHRNASNLGLTRSLNVGLAMCRSKYLARMDADDISAPRRFERQVALLEARPEIGVCGTRTRVLDERRTRQVRPPTSSARIAAELLFGNCIAHPSVMLRRQVLIDHDMRYDETMRRSQDYELWTRLAMVTQFAVAPEPLLHYRKHGGSVSHTDADAQRAARVEIARRYLRRLGASAPELLELHSAYMRRDFLPLREADAFLTWARGLLELGSSGTLLQADALLRAVYARVWEVFRWPSATRARVAAELTIAGARSARVSTLAGYGMAAMCLPAPLWSYVRYG